MKKYFSLLALLICAIAKAQTPQETAARNYVSANIVSSHQQLLTAPKLNTALVKILDAIHAVDSLRGCHVDSMYTKVGINDSLYFTICGVERAISIFTAPVLVDSSAYISMTQIDSVTVIFCDRTGRCDTLKGIMGSEGGISIPVNEIAYGTGTGVTSSTDFTHTSFGIDYKKNDGFILIEGITHFGTASLQTSSGAEGGFLQLTNNGGNGVNIKTTNVTGGVKDIQTPNVPGTIALRAVDSTGSPINMVYQGPDSLFHIAAVPIGGPSTDKLNDVTARDSALNHTIYAISNNSDTTSIRDSIKFKTNQSWNTSVNGLAGKTTHIYQDELYGTNDPSGKPYGRIYNHLWTNNYNGGPSSTHRRGFGQVLMGYNMNKGQGRENTSEAAFGMTLETDYQRSFEWYLHTETTLGVSYRPIMLRVYKDTTFCSVTFKGNYLQAQLPDSSAEYFNVQNGQMSVFNIPNRTAPSSTNTIFNLVKGNKTITLSNNSADLLFTGATNAYTFDNNIRPNTGSTFDLGSQSAPFKTVYTKAFVSSYVIPSDGNYTQLATDVTINFKNITTTRTCTLIGGVSAGQRLELISGQNTNAVTLAGTWPVKNIDGTTATSLPAGKSCVLVWDNSTFYWQVVSISSGTL